MAARRPTTAKGTRGPAGRRMPLSNHNMTWYTFSPLGRPSYSTMPAPTASHHTRRGAMTRTLKAVVDSKARGCSRGRGYKVAMLLLLLVVVVVAAAAAAR